jgi:hypothetical protein
MKWCCLYDYSRVRTARRVDSQKFRETAAGAQRRRYGKGVSSSIPLILDERQPLHVEAGQARNRCLKENLSRGSTSYRPRAAGIASKSERYGIQVVASTFSPILARERARVLPARPASFMQVAWAWPTSNSWRCYMRAR